MSQTAVEKIVQAHSVGLPETSLVHSGDYVTIRPRHVMTHDNTGAVLGKFSAIGAERVHDPRQPVFTLDHDIQNRSEGNLAKYERIESFARAHDVDFWPAGSGIGHQIMCQEGYVVPDSMVVASDSHSNIYGGLAAVGTPVVRTDAAAIWATGETWWQVPDVVRVVLKGRLRRGVRGKDVIIALIGTFRDDDALNCAIEFEGDGLASLSMDQRLTIANMSTEWGALVGRFPFDDLLEEWLLARAEKHGRFSAEQIRSWRATTVEPDPDAFYKRTLTIDLAHLVPQIAGPDEVKAITALPEMAAKKIPVHKAYLLSCVNSRLEDIVDAAEVVRGRSVAPGVELYLAAASREVEQEAERLGAWGDLVRAGAKVLPPGCGPCIGLGEGTLGPGENAISATNRNFQGRMGSRDARAYLASPAIVAASALAGHITGPEEFADEPIVVSYETHEAADAPREAVDFLEGFPKSVAGRLLFVPKDNMNTDGIYGKDFTYKDDLSAEEMAAAAMLNYDPAFQEIAREGDILVGGYNFGTGSSREQAATALAHKGIRMVVAGSFSQTYMRNAFNNGFITLACPSLVDALVEIRERGELSDAPTIALEGEAKVDFAENRIEWRRRQFPIPPLSTVAQELVLAGGAEAVVKGKI
ncbi:MAG: homoaconitase [Gemmatimonadetes bacterium]|nr:homoaconitase [Gemmatimonadota bacterium]